MFPRPYQQALCLAIVNLHAGLPHTTCHVPLSWRQALCLFGDFFTAFELVHDLGPCTWCAAVADGDHDGFEV